MDPQAVTSIALSGYGLQATDIAAHRGTDGSVVNLRWTAEGKQFRAEFISGTLQTVRIHWDSLAPSLADVLWCIGAPDAYEARYAKMPDAREFDFTMWYPAKGWIVSLTRVSRDPTPPVVAEQTEMPEMQLVASGLPLSEMVGYVYTITNEAVRQQVLQRQRPWPNSVSEIQVDVPQ